MESEFLLPTPLHVPGAMRILYGLKGWRPSNREEITMNREEPGMSLEHPWQDLGLGRAPFVCVGYFDLPSKALLTQNPEAYNAAMRNVPQGYGVGTCKVCGQAIMMNCMINSADGRKFVVGCDCVLHTYEARLISVVEKLKKTRMRKKRAEAKAAKIQKRIDAVAAELDRQRKANGGLTDREAQQKRIAEAIAKAQEGFVAENGWLISALHGRGNFAESMVKKLATGALSEETFSPRMLDVMKDMFAVRRGRRGTKAYEAAVVEFDAKIGLASGAPRA